MYIRSAYPSTTIWWVNIYMTMPEGKQKIEGNIFFYSSAAPSNDSIVLVLACTFDLTGAE